MATIVISPNLDGDVHSTGGTFDGFSFTHFSELLSPIVRTYVRFPLTGIPSGSTITDVDLTVFWSSTADTNGGNVTNNFRIRPYGGVPGNRNIFGDTGATRYTQCSSGEYTVQDVGIPVAGDSYTKDLGATAEANVQTCLDTVGYFTLAFTDNPGETNNGLYMALTGHATYVPPKLTVTYTPGTMTKTPAVINLVSSFPALAGLVYGPITKTPTVITLVSSIPTFTSNVGLIKSPSVLTLVSSIPTFTISRTYNPDTFAGKVGVAFITQGSVSTVSGDTDATGIKLIVQSGTSLLGFGLNRDGSPWLPGGTSDLGGCISGAAVNMSELTFPRPMKLSRIVVHTKNMNETRGDKFQLALMLDGSNTARQFGAPIKQNGATERYINPGWGYVNRCVLQVSYTNTSPTTKAVPCAITKIELFGKPTGKKLVGG